MSRPINAKPHGGSRGADRIHNVSRSHSSPTIDPAQQLLSRLEGVIKTGKGWIALCPAHADRRPSLSITEGDNGTLLVHDHAGCSVHDVLAAVGLKVGDLFQRRDFKTMTPIERSQFKQAALLPKWRAALDVLTHEASVLQIAASKMGDGFTLDDEELTRMRISALRIFDAKEVLHGH